METSTIQVDSELAGLLPDLDGATFGSLREDISQRGIQVPVIVTEDGTIIDGHHRFRIAKELGIDSLWMSVAG